MKKLLIAGILFYRKARSPYSSGCCRFIPTCSEYALDAIREKGACKGLLLAIFRILRCNPFGKSGFDPVNRVNRSIYGNK